MWHVVHVITRLDLGGAQKATLYESAHTEFADAGRTLLYGPGGLLDTEAQALEDVDARPVEELQRELSPIADLKAGVALWRELRAIRSRNRGAGVLVHTHSSKAGILGRWAARLAGVERVVHSVHGFGHSHHGGRAVRVAFRIAEWLTGKITDAFTADSAANLHQGRAEGVMGHAPARVVRCGIDVEAFSHGGESRALRRELGIPDDHAVVLGISNLKPQKDPETFVRVAARVIRERPATTFLLTGDGELRDRVEALARELGLGRSLQLLGWRRDVPELLRLTDLMLLTSRWEGLPQAFPQAMAAGVPVVATRVDGAPEAIEHGTTGLLYDPGDATGLAHGVTTLLDDSERRASMAAAAKPRVATFSREQMVADLDRLYRQITHGG